MIRSIFIIAHLSVLCMGSERVGYPGYELFSEVKGWLKLHVEPTTWKAARTNCRNEAALLASPWMPEFEPAVRRLLSTRFHTIPKVYSGAGLRSDSPGIPLEPCSNKRCRVFLASGGMDKVHCDDQLPYVCYAPAPPTPSCASSSSTNGYEFKSEMGECYKYHADAATLPAAKEICGKEGAFLAYISSEVEKNILQAMSNGGAFIEGGGSQYRHLHSSGYSDYYCAGAHPFICEMLVSAAPAAAAIGSDFID